MRPSWQGVRRRLGLTRPQPTILMYHRIDHVSRDPWDLAVSPKMFEMQMRFLREHREVLSMPALVRRMQNGTLPQTAVAVTFDDGYRDNLVHAKPVLERYGIEATLFVATGLVGKTEPMWWDALAGMILEAREPADFILESAKGNMRLHWKEREDGDAHLQWKGWEPPLSARQRCFQEVWRGLKAMPVLQREESLRFLRARLPFEHNVLAEPMTREELYAMQAGGLVALAPHTVTHASLPTLSAAACREEVLESARACRTLTDAVVEGFAYPYGDVDEQAVQEVRQADLGWACTTAAGAVSRSSDLLRLSRVGVPSASMQIFQQLLQG